MKRIMMTCLLAVLVLTMAEAQTVATWPEVSREAKAGSRWWWQGSAVDQDNLRWQMQQLADAGIGTLEITPIYGVKGNAAKNIPFLSSKWLEMLNYTQQLGDELGIDIDMATGTGWPFGGPMVKLSESASKLLTETVDVTGDGATAQTVTLTTSGGTLQRLMAFPQSGNDGQVTDLTALVSGKSAKWTAPAGKWKVIAAYCQSGVMQVKRPSPGSEGYVVDYFDADAVANYLKYFDSRFADGAGRWPHSFFNDSYEITQADWTPRMFEHFERLRGYKLEEHLDKLLNRDKQVYADYRQTLADLLRDNFTKQWTAWAHTHGATTRNQAHGSPGNLIDLYAAADIPETESFYLNSFGIKGLRDDKGFYNTALSTRATLKYASSAAHITGKRLTSSESMTWLTEHFRTSLSQIKPELDLLFTSGINHVLFHGTAYSPQDAAWPGWKFYAAVDMSPTNSIWYDAPSMMQYIARVQSFLQMGRPDNDVLVYAPFANAMHKNTGQYQNRMALFDINTLSVKMTELEQCVNALEKMGLDCDYTSEYYLMHTTFVDGQLQTEAGTRYRALVLPVTDNLPDSVKTHIDALRAQGAQIVEGYKADALSALTLQPEELRTQLGLSVIRRSNDTGYHYFIANLTPNDAEGYVALTVDKQGVACFDPMTGDIYTPAMMDGKVWISLKSGQSLLLQTYNTAVTTERQEVPVREMSGMAIDKGWTLDFDGGMHYDLEALQSWETLDEKTASLMGTGTYATTFTVTASQLKSATGGFRINLGDVRESARVWINGEYIGCAWAAPFVLDCKGLVREGTNTLRIEVTNLPANRIRQMDIEGAEWRIFEDINMSSISTSPYSGWTLVPSGLNSTVQLVPLATWQTSMNVELAGMTEEADGNYYAQYSIQMPDGTAPVALSMTDASGAAFTGFKTAVQTDGSMLLTVTGSLGSLAIIQASDAEGTVHYANVPARGAYSRMMAIDMTQVAALSSDVWDKMKTQLAISGFNPAVKLEWYRTKKSTKVFENLFEGVDVSSEKAGYYFMYPGYGMNCTNDALLTVRDAAVGDLCHVSYLIGDGSKDYQAADSLNMFIGCESAIDGLVMSLKARSAYAIYRSLAVYRPVSLPTAIRQVWSRQTGDSEAYYNLQGVRVNRPQKGVYIRNGRKVVF